MAGAPEHEPLGSRDWLQLGEESGFRDMRSQGGRWGV